MKVPLLRCFWTIGKLQKMLWFFFYFQLSFNMAVGPKGFDAIMSSSVFPCILAHLPLVHPSFPLSLSLPVIGLLETALLIVISGGASALALSLPWLMFSGSYLNQHQSFIGAQTVHVGGTSSGIMCVHCVQSTCIHVCTSIYVCVLACMLCELAEDAMRG